MKPLSLTGTVVGGKGEAVYFTQLDWVQHQCADKLGFHPFPGTLNLKIEIDDLWRQIANSYSDQMIQLVPTDPSFCNGDAIPCTLFGVQTALILPEEKVRVHSNKIVEIVAPIHLRDAFALKENDSVTVRINGPKKIPVTADAAIFDLDGTLIDSARVYYMIIEAAFERLGLPKVPRDTILEASKQDEFAWNLILPSEPLREDPRFLKRVLACIKDVYPDIFHKQATPFPGTMAMLKRLARLKIPIGVVTSTLKANMTDKNTVIKKYGLDRFLRIIITIDDTKKEKPAPDPLYLCAKKLDVPPETCVYVGDMTTDIEAGKNAGMKTVAVLTGFDNYKDLKATGPDHIIGSVAQLEQVVRFEKDF